MVKKSRVQCLQKAFWHSTYKAIKLKSLVVVFQCPQKRFSWPKTFKFYVSLSWPQELDPRSFGQKLVLPQASKVGFNQRLFSAPKQPQIGKIRPLLLLQLFELMERKCRYFFDSRLFSCRKRPLKKSNLDSLVRHEFLTK